MNTLLEEIVNYLAAQGRGTSGVDIFAVTMPDTPDICLAIIQNGGPREPGARTRRISIQMLCRHTSEETGTTIAQQVYDLFNSKWNVLSSVVGRFVAESEPGTFFRDDSNRLVFSLNFTFITTTPNT